jgi:hypothetical protein
VACNRGTREAGYSLSTPRPPLALLVLTMAEASGSYKGNTVVPIGVSVVEEGRPRKKEGWSLWKRSSVSTGTSQETPMGVAAAQHKRIVPVRIEPKTFFVSRMTLVIVSCVALIPSLQSPALFLMHYRPFPHLVTPGQ